MKTRTRKSELQSLLAEISKLSGISTEKKDGEKYHLFLDFAACYGGYRLVKVNNETGAHLGAFGESSCCERLRAGKMADKLRTIINTLEVVKNPVFGIFK